MAGTGNRAGIGIFTGVVAIVVAPLSLFATFLGAFIACFGDHTSKACNPENPDLWFGASITLPVVLVLLIGGLATYRRSWKLALLGAGVGFLILVATLGAAILVAE